jgi:hypothetical protein
MVSMAVVVASAVIPATVVPAAVISVGVSVAPIRPVVAVSVVGRAVIIGTRPVIAGSVKERNRNRQPKAKVDTGARRRFSEERHPRDNHQQNNKLLHNK